MAWNNLNVFITVPFFCVSLLGLPGQRKKAKIHCVTLAQKVRGGIRCHQVEMNFGLVVDKYKTGSGSDRVEHPAGLGLAITFYGALKVLRCVHDPVASAPVLNLS